MRDNNLDLRLEVCAPSKRKDDKELIKVKRTKTHGAELASAMHAERADTIDRKNRQRQERTQKRTERKQRVERNITNEAKNR